MPIVPAVPLEAARRSRRRRKLHHPAVWKPVGWPTSFGPPQLWNRQFIVHSSVHTLYLPCPAYIGEIHKVTIIYLQLSPNHPFLWDFPWNQASSCYWGYHHLWNAPYITVPNISNINCTCFIFFSVKSPSYSRKIYETSQSWPDFSASKRGKKGSFTVSQIHMVYWCCSKDSWLVVYLPLWKMMYFVSWDDSSQYMDNHKIPWFQTTNQIDNWFQV